MHRYFLRQKEKLQKYNLFLSAQYSFILKILGQFCQLSTTFQKCPGREKMSEYCQKRFFVNPIIQMNKISNNDCSVPLFVQNQLTAKLNLFFFCWRTSQVIKNLYCLWVSRFRVLQTKCLRDSPKEETKCTSNL